MFLKLANVHNYIMIIKDHVVMISKRSKKFYHEVDQQQLFCVCCCFFGLNHKVEGYEVLMQFGNVWPLTVYTWLCILWYTMSRVKKVNTANDMMEYFL